MAPIALQAAFRELVGSIFHGVKVPPASSKLVIPDCFFVAPHANFSVRVVRVVVILMNCYDYRGSIHHGRSRRTRFPQ